MTLLAVAAAMAAIERPALRPKPAADPLENTRDTFT
jgi:hypothetical protein